MEIEDIYKVHREYIEHEDELIHHRTSALVTIQSFLLATFGFTYQKKYEVAGMLFIHDHKLSLSDLGSITTQYNGFLLVLALVGAATSFIALCSILAATNAIKGIERNWQQVSNGQPLPHLPGLTGGGSSVSSATGVALCILAPISFWILWMATLFYLILVDRTEIDRQSREITMKSAALIFLGVTSFLILEGCSHADFQAAAYL